MCDMMQTLNEQRYVPLDGTRKNNISATARLITTTLGELGEIRCRVAVCACAVWQVCVCVCVCVSWKKCRRPAWQHRSRDLQQGNTVETCFAIQERCAWPHKKDPGARPHRLEGSPGSHHRPAPPSRGEPGFPPPPAPPSRGEPGFPPPPALASCPGFFSPMAEKVEGMAPHRHTLAHATMSCMWRFCPFLWSRPVVGPRCFFTYVSAVQNSKQCDGSERSELIMRPRLFSHRLAHSEI